MVNWLKKILQAWRSILSPAILQVPLAPEWTIENSAELKKFLSSQTGQVLLKRARAMEAHYAIQACYKGEPNPVHVSGITFTLNWIEKLVTLPQESGAQDSKSERIRRQYDDASLPEFA